VEETNKRNTLPALFEASFYKSLVNLINVYQFATLSTSNQKVNENYFLIVKWPLNNEYIELYQSKFTLL